MATSPAPQPKKGHKVKNGQAEQQATQTIVKEFLDWTGRSGTPPNGDKSA